MSMIKALTVGLLALLPVAGTDISGPSERDRHQALRHYRAGQDALARERFEMAVEQFQVAVRLDPLLIPAHYGLGQAYMALKRYPDAVGAYTLCRESFHQEEANALTDRLAADRRLFEQIQALEDNMRALQRLASGNSLESQRARQAVMRKDEEIRSLQARRQRTADAPSPTPHWLSLALGSAHFRNGHFAQAEVEYKKALEAKPNLGEAHNNLAVVYMLTGRLEEAEAALASAEKAGFRVNAQLKRDIEVRRQQPPRPQ